MINSPIGHIDAFGLWTCTIGFSFSGGAGLGGNVSFYFGFDGHGNVGGGVTIGHGIMVGGGGSLTGDINISNANDLNQIGGKGGSVGVSGGEGLVGGADVFWGGNPGTGDDYIGGSGHFGIGFGTPGEVHTGPSYTWN